MKLMPRRQLTDKLAWHCRDNFSGSRSYHSVRPGSFFRSSRVPLKKAIHLIYLWAQDSSVKAVADTLDVSRQCVQQHFQFLREVCSTHLLETRCLLADETSSCRSMSHSSAKNPSTTVVELLHLTSVCLGCATSKTPDPCAQTLIPIIERVVRHGAIIHSDKWAAYRQLNANYTYATVNHSGNLVDPVTVIRSQAIESYWATAKHKFKAMKGVSTDLDERMWRDRHGPDATAAFHHICSHIHDVYPV